MQRLAAIKIGLRRQFLFPAAPPGPVHDRHWLSYPVTNHRVNAWGNNARLPNTLRFKVRSNGNGKLVGVIFHVPHCPPSQFQPNPKVIRQVWSTVYGFLDEPAQQLTRIPE
jgi:CRISPR-associated protein Cmr1